MTKSYSFLFNFLTIKYTKALNKNIPSKIRKVWKTNGLSEYCKVTAKAISKTNPKARPLFLESFKNGINKKYNFGSKYLIAITFILTMFCSPKSRADLWGADLPLLVEIVANTLQTYFQLKEQTELMREEYRGIKDKINRLETIKDIIQPDNLEAWKDPRVAVKRLQDIYYTLPPEFRTGKSDEIERQMSQAMSLAARISDEAKIAFKSGKQLERNALSVGPAVANKMTASGVGTLISLESQNQVAQATIISLLSNMVAENASRDASYLKSQIREFQKIEQGMGGFVRAITLGGRKYEE